tara:strand:+ start:173 stop:400 length:228 start_codon:yes stop_codon:yes gene_type:complete
LSVRPQQKCGLLYFIQVAHTPPFMKTKDIIYNIITKEFKKLDDKSFLRRSTLLNFTNTIKKQIEKKLGENHDTKS